jgi:hypothetical protein
VTTPARHARRPGLSAIAPLRGATADAIDSFRFRETRASPTPSVCRSARVASFARADDDQGVVPKVGDFARNGDHAGAPRLGALSLSKRQVLSP